MKKNKSNLDEMQEMQLLKIEHRGCWLGIWGLVIAIIIQNALGDGFENVIGESIVLLVLSGYLLFACIKNGIWDRKLKPNLKTNLLVSLLTSVASGIFWFIVSYYRYHILLNSVMTFVFMTISVFILVMLCLSFFSFVYKKRKNRLDMQIDKEESEE